MKITTRSKASILARLNAIHHQLKGAIENTRMSKTARKIADPALDELRAACMAAATELEGLLTAIESEVKEECDPLLFYDQKTFEVTAKQAREEVVKRFAHFPMSAALIDMFLMFFELKLQFNSSFLALREKCGVEDRSRDNPSHYNTNGDPNKQ